MISTLENYGDDSNEACDVLETLVSFPIRVFIFKIVNFFIIALIID